jgi:hypothetical protein
MQVEVAAEVKRLEHSIGGVAELEVEAEAQLTTAAKLPTQT